MIAYSRGLFLAVASANENPQTAEFCRKLGIDNPFRPGGKFTYEQKSKSFLDS